MTTPTMTPETREELARAILGRTAPRAADAIAPIIEGLVAERVAAETERYAGIAREHDDPHLDGVGERIATAIKETIR